MPTVFDIEIDKHVTLVGETGEGKTPIADNLAQNSTSEGDGQLGKLVFDLEGLSEFDSDLDADTSTDVDKIKETLENGGTVNFTVPEDKEKRAKSVLRMFKLLKKWKLHVIVIADEIQEYGTEDGNPFVKYATRGRKYGVHLIAISQRIAKIPTTIASQSNIIIHLEVSQMEERYYRDRSIPYEKFGTLRDLPKHTFRVYVRGTGISEPLRLNI